MSIDAPDGLPGDGERPVLAVVIETGRLAAGLVDGAGGVIVRDRIAIPAHDVWPGLERLIGRVLAAAPRTVEPPQAVGVLCSGTVDTRAGAVSPHYVPAWSVFPLRQRLEDLTERPVVLDTLGGGLALARLRAIDDRARAAETASDVDEWPEHVIRSRSFLELRVGATVDSG